MLFRKQNWLSQPIQDSYLLLCGQNGLSKPIQESYMLCCGENRLWTSTGLLHAFRWSKWTLRTSTGILHSFQWLKRIVQTPKASYMHCGCQNKLSKPLQDSYKLSIGQTDSPNFYRHPTCFVVVKTDSPKLSRPPTRFAPLSEPLQASYMLLGDPNGLFEPL